ncbi:hypothetical protein U27_02528 [Candidatus Vecturithrix granuli]|uniref:Outer membrane lipoprotein BamD-like domain-containing protein n=1 Tax=Vecturithrix granuli TaxID=1499967 RepID=A0A081CAU4_VECG1|nr:hypothetical protein U27_02528 [Candidatus Vecturithrix granuli]
MRNRQQSVLLYSVCVVFVSVLWGEIALASARTQLMEDIQQQILTLRKEFKLQMERSEDAQHAIAEKLQDKITNLLSTQESIYSSQPEVAQKIQQLQTLLDAYAVQMDSLEHITDAMEMTMQNTLDQIEQRFSQIKKQGIRRPRPVTAAPTPPQEGTIPEFAPGQFFRGVYRIFMDGDYETAIAGFQKFLTDFPSSPLAGAAQYWIAEAFVRQEEYDRALQEYDRLIKTYPSNDKIPDAYYGIGIVLMRLGRPEEAKTQFRYVLDHFSGTLAAQKAQNRLQE